MRNDCRVRKITDWVKEALFGSFGAEGGRFIMVGNLISKCSVLANIAASKGVEVSQVNVLDKKVNLPGRNTGHWNASGKSGSLWGIAPLKRNI